ncbi:Rieske 2Fe-2S domain-containing protein [Thiomonas intermedia]|uniref:Rieske 2Fe-2S domain-containing protein n=1 Tax=Thiomonas intermedia TaxID=926 RepID=UPI0009A4D930|nr:Rieske 2Fe-2S domain-containing protein [Thiomonas intermedia]
MQRRRFIQICSTAAAGCAALDLSTLTLPAWAADVPDVPQPPVLLTDAQGAPLKASQLGTREAYVFSYPYASTPAFLIRLQGAAAPAQLSAEGQSYDWPGGVGPDKTLVAYTAICAHQLSYPEKDSSVISYDPKATQVSGKPGMIVCCAHQSVYDPSEGAKVMSGPAPHPLAAIILQHDPQADTLTATGVIGHPMFEHFFKLYRLQLIHTYGAAHFQATAPTKAAAVPLSQYSAYVAHC